MNEIEMTQTFTEALRLYAERLRNSQHLGPFKQLLSTGKATVNVQFDGSMLTITNVEDTKEEMKSDTINIAPMPIEPEPPTPQPEEAILVPTETTEEIKEPESENSNSEC